MVARGLAPDLVTARALIMAGRVKHGSTVINQPGTTIPADTQLTVTPAPRYVSRGAEKLESVAKRLALNFVGAIVLDAGASTGGFTDFCLQHGATKVYAVDVGTAQLAHQLRHDPRVIVMERTDIRDLTPGQLNPRPTMAVVDVSFISLTKILPTVARLVGQGGLIVAMAKPQFEADKPTADRHRGIIRDEPLRQRILQLLQTEIKKSFTIVASADSTIPGARGNRERFYVLKLHT